MTSAPMFKGIAGSAPVRAAVSNRSVTLPIIVTVRERLSLVYAAEQLDTLISGAVKHETSPHQIVDRLLDSELDRGEERRLQTSLRLSGLPMGQRVGLFAALCWVPSLVVPACHRIHNPNAHSDD